MEHLLLDVPTALDPFRHVQATKHQRRLIRVPYFYGKDYSFVPDVEGTLAYRHHFQTEGWDFIRLVKGDFAGRSESEALAFLQSYLYFGLLQEVLGVKVKTDDFLRYENEQVFISTSNLPVYFSEWKDRVEAEMVVDVLASEKRKGRIEDMLSCAQQMLKNIFRPDDNAWYSTHAGAPELFLSIGILAETLEWGKIEVFGERHLQQTGTVSPMSFSVSARAENGFASAAYMQRLMEADGWCSHQVGYILSNLGLTGMYFCYTLGTSSGAKSHKNCSMERCVVSQIDEATYTTVHSTLECRCSHVFPDMPKMKAIISQGGIPLICMNAKGNDTTIEVIQWRPGIAYVAVSHVWADGLGNVAANSLPHCQLQNLRDRFTKSPLAWEANESQPTHERIVYGQSRIGVVGYNEEKVHFWIDTLCVPLNPKAVRKAAIQMMRQCYEQAAIVWVLDAEIMQCSKNDSYEEVMVRISCSQWLRRLWTLQEGAFAKNLVFELKDSTSYLNSLAESWRAHKAGNLYDPLPWRAYALIWKMRDLESGDESRRLTLLCEELQWRSTSKSADEAICMATLLGLDLAAILSVPDEEKMPLLFMLRQSFPSDILFWQGNKTQKRGFRWAPDSFLSRHRFSTNNIQQGLHHNEGKFNVLGLWANYSGVLIPAIVRTVPFSFKTSDDDDEATGYNVWPSADSSSRFLSALENRPAALLLRRPMKPTGAPDSDLNVPRTVEAVLVGIYGELAGVYFVHYASRVSVYRFNSRYLDRNVSSTIKAKMWGTHASWTKNEQRWCIG